MPGVYTRLADSRTPKYEALLPPFEQAWVTYRQDRTMAGQPRTSRRDRAYDHCPWPTLSDKRLFSVTYVQQHPMQAVQGQRFGRSPSHANTWIHVRHAVLHQA